MKASDSFVAHALRVPRRDSSRRLVAVQPQTTKQTQSRKPQWNQWLLRVKKDSEGRSGGITFQLQRGCSASAPQRCDRVGGSVPDGSIAPWQARLHLVPAGLSQAAGVPRRLPADGRKKVQTAMLEFRSCSLMKL